MPHVRIGRPAGETGPDPVTAPHPATTPEDVAADLDVDIALFEHLTNELVDSMPRSMGHFRLRTYDTVRAVLDVRTGRGRYAEQRTRLRNELDAGRSRHHLTLWLTRTLEDSPVPGSLLQLGRSVLRETVLRADRWAFGWRLARGRHHRCLTEHLCRQTRRRSPTSSGPR